MQADVDGQAALHDMRKQREREDEKTGSRGFWRLTSLDVQAKHAPASNQRLLFSRPVSHHTKASEDGRGG